MKRLSREALAYIVVLLTGIIVVIAGILFRGNARLILLSVGSAFLATALVTLFIQLSLGNPFKEIVGDITRSSDTLTQKLNIAVQVLESSTAIGMVSAYSSRSEFPTDDILNLMRVAEHEISLLAYAMAFLPEYPETLSILMDRAKVGCSIRILLGKPKCKSVKGRNIEESTEGDISSRIETSLVRLNPLLEFPNVEIRLHDTPLYASIYRFDGNMIVTPQLYGKRGASAPVFQFLDKERGIFPKYLTHFDDIWSISEKYFM